MLFQWSKIWSLKKQIEDKESLNSYETETVEFLDHINFDNDDFDDNAIDYMAESI